MLANKWICDTITERCKSFIRETPGYQKHVDEKLSLLRNALEKSEELLTFQRKDVDVLQCNRLVSRPVNYIFYVN